MTDVTPTGVKALANSSVGDSVTPVLRPHRALGLVAMGFWVLVLQGCVGGGPVLAPEQEAELLPDSVELTRTPFFPQDEYQCGPAALATILVDAGLAVTPEDLVQKVYIPERRGSLQIEMLAATRSMGRLPYVIDPDVGALMGELAGGRPVLVLQNLGLRIAPLWHYAVVSGYDVGSDKFILRSGVTERRVMSAPKFASTWDDSGNWGMIALRPGELPANPDPARYLQAAARMEGAGQVCAARLAYLIAVDTWPRNSTARFGLANTYYAAGEFAEAERIYRQLLDKQPLDAAILNNLAMVLLHQGRCQDALETNDHARSISGPGGDRSGALEETRDTIVTRCHEDSRTGSPDSSDSRTTPVLPDVSRPDRREHVCDAGQVENQ
ncbi:MAG: PA2778 family cysteine peptidase [Gammaproteobacteria bacterium]|nr:MAG: PA2778 family cysteine peptidase [Gammaproteobacteria bacterium]